MELIARGLVSGVVVVALASACRKDKDGPPPDIVGKAVEPPAGTAKVRPGMTTADVRALLPDLKIGEGVLSGMLVHDTARANAKVVIVTDYKEVLVTSLRLVVMTADLEPELIRAWGPPAQPGKRPVWIDERTGWRAELLCFTGADRCQVDFETYKPFRADLFGARVGPPGPLAAIKTTSTIEEVKKLPGVLIQREMVLAEGVSAVVEPNRTAGVGRIRITLSSEARDMVVKAWGPPKQVRKDGRDVEVWHDPDSGWRAILEKDAARARVFQLRLEPYLPVARLLGDGPDIAALPMPLMGKPEAEVRAAFPWAARGRDGRSLDVLLPPSEWESYDTRVQVVPTGGKVTGVSIDLAYGTPEARDEILGLLKKKWGEPKQVESGGRKTWVFRDAGPRIEAVDTTAGASGSVWRITFS